MGGSDPPYLYDPPSHERRSAQIAYPYSDFNPKAVTEASYKRLSQQTTNSSQATKKQEGPLINFNAHPDSWVVHLGDNKEHKPLPPSTKKAVVAVRWVQWALRLLQEVAALGLLVATICIKGTSGAETYLLRIPQAWDSLITLYAIYHLLRPAKGRTPASSASYHSFALVMDVALIPLYVYIALLVNNNRTLHVPEYNDSGEKLEGNWRWTSFFSAQASTDLLLLITFLVAAVVGGLHLLSCGLDLYLTIMFRKIAALPPDMNPLEDNLTSRRSVRQSKHKYKNSEMTMNSNASAPSLDQQKRLAHLSGSTLSIGRDSTAEKSVYEEAPTVPFGHSRTGSKTSLAYSPHNPDSARWSRHQYDGQQPLYQEALASPRRSRYEVRADGKLEVRTRRGSQSPSKSPNRASFVAASSPNRASFVPDSPQRGTFETQPQRQESPDRASYHTAQSATVERIGSPNFSRPDIKSQQAEQKTQLLNDNWYVLDASDDDIGSPSRNRSPAPPAVPSKNGYMAISSAFGGAHDRHDSFEPVTVGAGYGDGVDVRDMIPKPLGMHPPTPPLAEEEAHHYPDPAEEQQQQSGVGRSLTVESRVTESSSVYSESAPSLKSAATPKGRYYGDLAAATRGVRGGYGIPPSPQPSRTPSPEKQSRVISRTGADIADESVLYVPESGSKYGMRSRREVSGKVAEEGRGGGSWDRRHY